MVESIRCHEIGDGASDDLVARVGEHQPDTGVVDVEDMFVLLDTDPVGTAFHKSAVGILGQPRGAADVQRLATRKSLSRDLAKLPGAGLRHARFRLSKTLD